MLQTFVLFFHLILAFLIIGLVLLQHGKGADVGASFGSGASGSVFGSAGSATFLTRFTTLAAALFAVTSISLTLIANKGARTQTLSEKLEQSTTVQTPAVPAATPAQPAPEVPVVPNN